MAFTRPTLTELVQRIRSDFWAKLDNADSWLRRSVLSVIATVMAGVFHAAYGYLERIAKNRLPSTADADLLDQHGADWGILRKPATAASGLVNLTGTTGAVVPVNSLLVRSDGAEYRTATAVTLVAGAGSVSVNAVIAGSEGNASAGQSLTFAAPVVGVNAVAIAAAGLSLGNAAEDDEAYRARIMDRVRQQPHGGNRNDWRAWALEVPGVTRAWVSAGEMGLGTVTVRFVADALNDIIPTPALIAQVEAHLDEVRPVAAQAFVVAPIPVPIDLIIRAVPGTVEVEAAITEEIRDLLRREAEPGGTILISHIREAISLVAGEFDHETIQPSTNIIMDTSHLPVFGSIAFV